MAQITDRILPSALEVIRDQIGVILADEIANQAVLNQTADPDLAALLTNFTLFSERFEPPNDNELPAVLFFFFNGDFDQKSQHTKRGIYHYYLDLYTSAISNPGNTSSQVASADAQRIAMIINHILEHPHYLTLNLPTRPNPVVARTQVINIKRTEEENTHSGLGVMMYRIIFQVEVSENTGTITGVPVDRATTNVRIEQTDLGYQYIYQA